MKFLKLLIITGLLIILTLQFLLVNIKILQSPGYDYSFFYRTGQRTLSHQNPYLEIDLQPLRYPPTALLIFSFFTIFPLIESQFIFFFTSLIIFIIGSAILFKSITKLDKRFFQSLAYPEAFSIYFIFVLLFFPFRYLLSSLHIHSLIFLLFSLMIYFLITKKDYFAGLSLALAGSITVNPLFMLIIFFVQKKFKVLFYTFINLFLIALITMFILGQDIYLKFLPSTADTLDFGITAYYNQSITSFLSKIIHDQNIVKIIIIVIIIINLGIFTFLARRFRSKFQDLDLISWNIGIILLLIFAPFSWQYHYILTLIPFVFLFYFWKKYSFSKFFLSLMLLSYFLIGLNIKSPNLKLPLGLDLILLSHVFWGGFILLFLSFFTLKKLITRS